MQDRCPLSVTFYFFCKIFNKSLCGICASCEDWNCHIRLLLSIADHRTKSRFSKCREERNVADDDSSRVRVSAGLLVQVTADHSQLISKLCTIVSSLLKIFRSLTNLHFKVFFNKCFILKLRTQFHSKASVYVFILTSVDKTLVFNDKNL
jgi:hypothetical protein